MKIRFPWWWRVLVGSIVLIACMRAAGLCAQEVGFLDAGFVAALTPPQDPEAGGDSPNPPDSPIVAEDFNGTGYVLPSWSEALSTDGVIDEDYTADTLEGTHSLYYHNSVVPRNVYVHRSFTAQSVAYGYFRFKPIDLQYTQDLVQFQSSGFAVVMIVRYIDGEPDGDGVLEVTHGADEASTTAELNENDEYHVWCSYTASGQSTVAFTAVTAGADARPTTGPQFATTTAGNATADAARLFLGGLGTDYENTFLLDLVWVDDEAIPDQ